ncbi:monocarboxylate transporter 12-like isoform X2 [Cherax quadricarinatus]|uniref:monocarboxylate transporter 12-like isoform X2 n=1 Tax=Cherax quadricarinatus TaxID=27406 RepID=UPI00387EB7EB
MTARKTGVEGVVSFQYCLHSPQDLVIEVSGAFIPAAVPTPLRSIPAEAPTDTPAEAPRHTPAEAPSDTPAEAPSDAPAENPTDAPVENPTSLNCTSAEDATNRPAEAPCDTSAKAPRDTPVEAPTNTPVEVIPPPPSGKDGGYGWLVVGTVFFINLVAAGYVKSFGILYIFILEHLPETTAGSAGWILGLLVGCRGLLCTGLCMTEIPGCLVAIEYFHNKRLIASGLRTAGNPMGGILFPPLIVFLHDYFGLRGTFVILAGIMLHMVVFGLLMRPYEMHRKILHREYHKKILKSHQGHIDAQEETRQDTLVILKTKGKKRPLDFTFLKNPAYVVYLVMVLCVNIAMPNALLYTPVYGRAIGLSAYENSVVASYISVCDFCCRLVCGWLTNKKIIKTRYAFIAGLVTGGVSCLLVPLCTTLWQLLAATTMLALCTATFWTLINILLADQFGDESMATTWGFFRMTQGVCSLFYPAIIGMVLDQSGGMGVPYMMMGGMLMLGASIISLQPLIATISGAKVNID